MKINTIVLLGLSFSLILGFSACEKEDEDEDTASATSDEDEGDEEDDDDEDEEEEENLEVSQLLGTSIHRSSASTPLAQSFTALTAFSLNKVSVYVSNTNGVVAGSISVIIGQGGSAPAVSSRISDWASATSTYSSGSGGWVDFEFATPVSLTANTVYWIEVWPASPTDFSEESSGPYSGGSMMRMQSSNSAWVSTQESGQPVMGDMKFRVYSE